jgi:hypothetical protein
MTLSVNKQVVMDTLHYIQYRIYGAIHMQLYATSLQLISALDSHAHSNVANEMPTWLSFPSICQQMMYATYLQLIYN